MNKKEITEFNSSFATEELHLKKLQLHWLLQITKAINYDLPASNLFDLYYQVLRDHIKVRELLLFIYNENEGWKLIIQHGITLDLSGIDFSSEFDRIEEKKMGLMNETSWSNSFEYIIPVNHNGKTLAYAFLSGINKEGYSNNRELLPFIHTITNIIVVAIENKRLNRDNIQQAAFKKEIELAAKMQSMLFPKISNLHPNIDLAATYIPHQHVGGDYYDFIKYDDHTFYLCMADVSGKGLSAALLMSNFQANLHALIKHNYSLEDMTHELNRCINNAAQGEKFITVFLGKLDLKTRQLSFINAGHNPPLILSKDSFTYLKKGTIGLGMFDELPFLNTGSISFPAYSILFCYTDGLSELENEQGEFFGNDNIEQMLKLNSHALSMLHLNEQVIHTMNAYRGEMGYTDDVTLLSCRIIG
ncbi:MAG TPA: PP2C family protein-serine/threonine phosphatase [Bacteroidia bacterium]|nr:PP2C family protein-serine/threonine phosphatase [Bacteroidia bacterium]